MTGAMNLPLAGLVLFHYNEVDGLTNHQKRVLASALRNSPSLFGSDKEPLSDKKNKRNGEAVKSSSSKKKKKRKSDEEPHLNHCDEAEGKREIRL